MVWQAVQLVTLHSLPQPRSQLLGERDSMIQVYTDLSLEVYILNNNPCYCRVLDQAEDSKVNVTLNYQSLCEGCARYIKSDLGNLYNNSELMSIVNLHLLPFGNAHIDQNQTVQCQEKSFAFIKCVEVGVLKKSDDDDDELKSLWNSCCEELKLDSNPIKDCYESGRGNKLLLGYGEESKAQVPPHMFVPWVTVNDVPLEFDIWLTNEASPIGAV
ncbi:gamma-interferon-responsive lysosomal thiol protein-like [Arachis stenosperma]|uniref:gamma-interferon-responsive lysosomal thiol protein-like n=1 Tax=Arachis stenosperma TaxID=217475 RepID=UPI0025AD854A|nr:gamma-interferon-responsive lysosomal thiol protein-like [Arachis stenosperma]